MTMATAIAIGIPVTACVGAAVYMAIHGIEGWGWFLFVGLLIAGALKQGV